MKKQYFFLSSLVVILVAFLLISSRSYAEDAGQFNSLIKNIQTHRAKVELQLGLDPKFEKYPHATSYYDDKEAHYEQELIMSDQIDEGI